MEGERREGGGCDSLKREERISNGGLTFSGTCNPGRGFVLNGGRGRLERRECMCRVGREKGKGGREGGREGGGDLLHEAISVSMFVYGQIRIFPVLDHCSLIATLLDGTMATVT